MARLITTAPALERHLFVSQHPVRLLDVGFFAGLDQIGCCLIFQCRADNCAPARSGALEEGVDPSESIMPCARGGRINGFRCRNLPCQVFPQFYFRDAL